MSPDGHAVELPDILSNHGHRAGMDAMNLASRSVSGQVWRISWASGLPRGEDAPVYLLPSTAGIDLVRSLVQLLWNGQVLPLDMQLATIRRGQPPFETEFLFDEQGPLVRCGDNPRLEARLVAESVIAGAPSADSGSRDADRTVILSPDMLFS